MCISNCLGYVLMVSSAGKAGRTYIQVVDIVTGSVLCSTYCQQLARPAILINPFQICLEFLVYTGQSVHFYRMSSILTLQTQELEKLDNIINNGNVGEILCARFLKLAEEELILLGMEDGSVLLVDSRANAIVMLCRHVCKDSIKDILYHEN